jgi:hypothetical protein
MSASIRISQKATILNNALWNFWTLVVYLPQRLPARTHGKLGLQAVGGGHQPADLLTHPDAHFA